jgi:hypothetical protein
LRPADGRAIRIVGRDGSQAMELAIADGVIGGVFWTDNGSTLRLYDREKITAPLNGRSH